MNRILSMLCEIALRGLAPSSGSTYREGCHPSTWTTLSSVNTDSAPRLPNDSFGLTRTPHPQWLLSSRIPEDAPTYLPRPARGSPRCRQPARVFAFLSRGRQLTHPVTRIIIGRTFPFAEEDGTMASALAQNWRRCGIHQGDTVLVHSSLKRTLQTHNTTPPSVMESFLEAVGPDGTVLFPLFNFDFTKGVPFDIRSTPSQMGALTEAARLHPNAERSGHPIYSFAVIGPHSRQFAVDNYSGYGPDSPFAVLRQLDGHLAVLDLDDLSSMTYYHHIEEMHGVPYRFHKPFTGQYTDAAGATSERTYSLFVRDLVAGVTTDVNPMGEVLWKKGLYHGDRPKQGIGLRVISANAMYDAVSEEILAGRALGLLYSRQQGPR
jgi:aminoglycoside 3-N-acetyltransferase